jgi:hypothetical protein
MVGKYFWNIVQAVDRMLNAIAGGTDKEYLSSRVYRYKDGNRIAGWVYVLLNWLEPNHCEQAYADAQIGFDPNDAVLK